MADLDASIERWQSQLTGHRRQLDRLRATAKLTVADASVFSDWIDWQEEQLAVLVRRRPPPV